MSESLSRIRGVQQVQRALQSVGIEKLDRVICSRDPLALKMRGSLTGVPRTSGVKAWQFPVILKCEDASEADDGIQFYVSVGEPSTKVEAHAHSDGDGLHIVASGSVLFGDFELTSGDWLYVPKGEKYSFEYGLNGAITIQAHCCCCMRCDG